MRLLTLTETPGVIKITNTQIHDSYQGESFGHKFVTVDGIVKVAADINILDDGEVTIMNIDTAEDSRRRGYATMLIDDLFKEYGSPEYHITTSMRTPDGAELFKQYKHRGDTLLPRTSS